MEVMKIALPSMFQALMNCSNYDEQWKKDLCEHISLILLVACVTLFCACVFCRVFGNQNGLMALIIVVVAIFGIFVMFEILAMKHAISSRVERLEMTVTSLNERVTVLEKGWNPCNAPTCYDVFEDHRKTFQIELNRIDTNLTSMDNRLTVLESRYPNPAPDPTPRGPISCSSDRFEKISTLETQVEKSARDIESANLEISDFKVSTETKLKEVCKAVESLTAVAPQTCNEVGSWMEAAHMHRVSYLQDRRGDIEADLMTMFIDADETFGKDSPLAISIKLCNSNITYKHTSSICGNLTLLDNVDIELVQLNGTHEYHTLLPAQLQRRIDELNSSMTNNIAAIQGQFNALAIKSRVIRGTVSGDDNFVELKCAGDELITGCTCHGSWKNCDGPLIIGIDRCHVYSGANEGITATATCITLAKQQR